MREAISWKILIRLWVLDMDQMDPALRAQREAFLKRAKSNPISSSTVTPSSSHSKSSKQKKKKKKSSLFPRPKPPTGSYVSS